MKFISELLVKLVDIFWGPPLIILLMGGGILLIFISKFKIFLGFKHAVLLLLGRVKHEGDNKGQLTPMQALSNALSATIGLGNISGVAVAIHQGGAGAIFWMWVSAIIGMNTKFFECSLAVFFRGEDYKGETHGGPMYVLEKIYDGKLKLLGYFFAIFGLFGTLSVFNANQLTIFVTSQYNVDPLVIALPLAFITVYILKGGIKRVAEVTSLLVPSMCIFYIISCILIIILSYRDIPTVFAKIFTEAFSGRAAVGGAMGVGIIQVFKIGVKRAAFSNEAGIGTAPMAHGNTQTSEPISEGLVAMLGPLIDTCIVCTLTALVILLHMDADLAGKDGILMTTYVFEKSLPGYGKHLLGIAIFFFSFSTIIGMANYNRKCWNYVFKGRGIFKDNLFIWFYGATIVMGAMATLDNVVNFLDICGALMAFPNMIATLIMAKFIKIKLDIYSDKYLVK